MIGGQSRLSEALGGQDPRNRRGGFLIDGLYTDLPIKIIDGKVSLDPDAVLKPLYVQNGELRFDTTSFFVRQFLFMGS